VSLICGSCAEKKGPTDTTTSPKSETATERASNAVVVGRKKSARPRKRGRENQRQCPKVGEKLGGAVEQTERVSRLPRNFGRSEIRAQKAGDTLQTER